MTRRKLLTGLFALLPCAIATRILGQTVETETQDYWHCAIQTNNLTPLSDEGLVKEFDRLGEGLTHLLKRAQIQNLKIDDIKFCWRNILTSAGPDRFVRVLIKSHKNMPVMLRNIV